LAFPMMSDLVDTFLSRDVLNVTDFLVLAFLRLAIKYNIVVYK